MINKLLGDKLNTNPKNWVDHLQTVFSRTRYIFLTIFVTINVAILIFTLGTSLIAIFGNAYRNADGTNTLPQWYPAFLVGVNAVGGFLVSLINFFFVRPRYQAASKNLRFIRSEKLLFETRTNDYATTANPELLLAQNVAKYMGYGAGEYN